MAFFTKEQKKEFDKLAESRPIKQAMKAITKLSEFYGEYYPKRESEYTDIYNQYKPFFQEQGMISPKDSFEFIDYRSQILGKKLNEDIEVNEFRKYNEYKERLFYYENWTYTDEYNFTNNINIETFNNKIRPTNEAFNVPNSSGNNQSDVIVKNEIKEPTL